MLYIYLLPMILFHAIKCITRIPTKKNDELFKYSVLACLICLLTIKAEAFCGEKTSLSATDGRVVVLHPVVAKTEELSIILWIREDLTEIATIQYLNESAEIQNNGGDKVNTSRDGSLTINNFTMEDQGTYIVVIKRLNQSDCKHMYDVSMSEKSPCGDMKDIAGREEEEITLPLDVNRKQLKIVYWFLPRGDLLAKTKPGGYIQPQSDYDRRLKTLPDGSLTIMKLTIKDQGIYVANVHMYSGRSCLQMYNVTISSIIPERAKTKTVNLFSYEEQKVDLPLPKHLVDQVEDVFWMKDYSKHITTTFKNGSLHVLDSRYQGRLYSTSNGSLIIHDLRIEDRGKYSADIHLINKELYTQIYHLSIYRKSYYTTYGTWNVSVTEGEDLILQNDAKEIKSIDWLTPRFIRFAVTTPGRDICILDRSYSDRLSSLKDGSITIKRVTKQDKGIYRAHMFSHNGMLLEQQYHVHIYEDQTLLYVSLGVAAPLVLIVFLMGYYCFYRVMKFKTGAYKMTPKDRVKTYKSCKTETVYEDFKMTRLQLCYT